MIRRRSSSSRRIVPTKRSAIAFARGARTGVLMILTSMAVDTASKVAVNLAVAVADEEPEPPSGVVEVHEQVAGLLGEPGAGGMRGDAEDVYAPGAVFDDEERIPPVQGDGVEMEQIAGQDRVRLRRRNWVHDGPVRRGEGSMPALCRMFQTVEAPIW